MRIVSQNGMINMPYEQTTVMIDDGNVVAVDVDSPFHRLMATYSSNEIALKAMDKLLNHWTMLQGDIFRFPSEEKLCADSSQ